MLDKTELFGLAFFIMVMLAGSIKFFIGRNKENMEGLCRESANAQIVAM